MSSDLEVKIELPVAVRELLIESHRVLEQLFFNDTVPELLVTIVEQGQEFPILPDGEILAHRLYLFRLAAPASHNFVEIMLIEIADLPREYRIDEGIFMTFAVRGNNHVSFSVAAACAIAAARISKGRLVDCAQVWSRTYAPDPDQLLSCLRVKHKCLTVEEYATELYKNTDSKSSGVRQRPSPCHFRAIFQCALASFRSR